MTDLGESDQYEIETRECTHAGMKDETTDSLEQVVIQFQHADLATLAITDVLDYDPRNRTVRYVGDPTFESIRE